MTRFRLALVAAIVALLAYSVLHHGTKWTTYHQAAEGWTIDVPASFTTHRQPRGATFLSVRDEGAALPATALSFGVARSPRTTKEADTRLPLDPVDLHTPSGVDGRDAGVRVLTLFHRGRIYVVSVVMHGTHWQATAFRMLRSLRFDR